MFTQCPTPPRCLHPPRCAYIEMRGAGADEAIAASWCSLDMLAVSVPVHRAARGTTTTVDAEATQMDAVPDVCSMQRVTN